MPPSLSLYTLKNQYLTLYIIIYEHFKNEICAIDTCCADTIGDSCVCPDQMEFGLSGIHRPIQGPCYRTDAEIQHSGKYHSLARFIGKWRRSTLLRMSTLCISIGASGAKSGAACFMPPPVSSSPADSSEMRISSPKLSFSLR